MTRITRFFLSLVLLPVLALSFTTIDDVETSISLWEAGNFSVLLDVRRLEEWNAGHLANATFIESLQTNKDVSRLAGCEDCAIAVYCKSGGRSAAAAVVMEDAGFTNVYNVLGVKQWTEAGVPLVVSDDDQDPSCDETCVELDFNLVSSAENDFNSGSSTFSVGSAVLVAISSAALFLISD